MNWQSAVERTVTGLGYDLIDAEKGVGGVLRVFIDHLATTSGAEQFITVDDCEKVTRQLQHVLEVEGCSYERLEVSSPGLDRPLRHAADYTRFAGARVEVTLRLPLKGRKKFVGELRALGDGWRLLLANDAGKVGARGKAPGRAAHTPGAQAAAGTDQALDFSLDEVREARLVPVVDFKGRPTNAKGAPLQTTDAGVGPADGNDGGRIQ